MLGFLGSCDKLFQPLGLAASFWPGEIMQSTTCPGKNKKSHVNLLMSVWRFGFEILMFKGFFSFKHDKSVTKL